MKKKISDIAKIYEVEKIQEYDKWIKEIPFFKFPKDWEIQIIPPFAGAVIRFRVRRNKSEEISVYLDCYGRLGAEEKPYWEIYPYKDDTYRCGIFEIPKLLNAIDRALGNKRRILTKS
jgi:hypothetical protein